MSHAHTSYALTEPADYWRNALVSHFPRLPAVRPRLRGESCQEDVPGSSARGFGPHLTAIWLNQWAHAEAEGSWMGPHYYKAMFRSPAYPKEGLRKERLETASLLRVCDLVANRIRNSHYVVG